jgi:hypothetical protein
MAASQGVIAMRMSRCELRWLRCNRSMCHCEGVYQPRDVDVACRVPFASTSPWIMFGFYAATSASLVSFSYFVASIFTRATVASFFCPLVYLSAMLPAFLAVYTQVRALHLEHNFLFALEVFLEGLNLTPCKRPFCMPGYFDFFPSGLPMFFRVFIA